MRQFDSSCGRTADFAGLEQINSFAQDLAKISAIHFVDYQKVGPGCSLARRLKKPSLLDAKTQLLAVNLRGEPDDEVLVRDGWMELNRLAARPKKSRFTISAILVFPVPGGPCKHDETTPPKEVVNACWRDVWEEIGPQAGRESRHIRAAPP